MSKARDYQEIAEGPFAPLYPFYAKRILEATGVREGVCVDLGCGGGHLGLALAAITSLELRFFDCSPQMLEAAAENAARAGMQQRAKTVLGEVQNMPFADGEAELLISRGSIPFWTELPKVFAECRRVLKSGGYFYIGCGLGTPQMREQIMQKMREMGEEKRPPKDPNAKQRYREALDAAGMSEASILDNGEGAWILYRKP